jgi:hypothetical protein
VIYAQNPHERNNPEQAIQWRIKFDPASVHRGLEASRFDVRLYEDLKAENC